MSRRSLRPQLNQIRLWVRQGRTDAWIAHQLEVSASELKEFRRQHDLSPETAAEADTAGHDLRDEIEAEIEAATAAEEAKLKAEEEERKRREAEAEAAGESDQGEEDSGADETEGGEAEGRPRRRRRGRRGRRNQLEGTFDHGDDGFGLWLDPAVQDLQNYTESWADVRDVTVTVERDQIVIRRAGEKAAEND